MYVEISTPELGIPLGLEGVRNEMHFFPLRDFYNLGCQFQRGFHCTSRLQKLQGSFDCDRRVNVEEGEENILHIDLVFHELLNVSSEVGRPGTKTSIQINERHELFKRD